MSQQKKVRDYEQEKGKKSVTIFSYLCSYIELRTSLKMYPGPWVSAGRVGATRENVINVDLFTHRFLDFISCTGEAVMFVLVPLS